MLLGIGIFIFLWLLIGFIVMLFIIKYDPSNTPKDVRYEADAGKTLLICTVLWPLVALMYSLLYINGYITKHNLNFNIDLNDLTLKFYIYCSKKLFGAPKE